MVFGFGFNKAKTFASAEKSVKQGKLHNAIADYEKISHEDPRDLNVLNNLGDLYARVGNVDRAAECFRRCGESYASEGFTVKAIAMYKKVTKQNPSATDAILKLAELYTLHGLYNDARVQYTQVAEHYQRNGQIDSAIVAFQKMLEFDPENSQLQSRLADLYVRSGKKSEARDLYFRSAQALMMRGNLEACDKALGSVLELEPGFAQAVLLRGQIKMEAGDAAGAAQCLGALPDIDSRPEALRMLLEAYLKQQDRTEAQPLARKLLTVYNDPSGISLYAESLITAGNFDEALGLFHEYSDRLMAADANALVQTLHSLISRVKDHSRSLESLSELFQRAGDTSHTAEVTELLAHACVQEGQLEKARDLYHKLSEMEPENPLHLQNYRQILAKLGQGDGIRELTPDESAQALMAEELEETPPPGIEQEYPPQVKTAILDALTEAELFASYNLPTRAIPLLEAALPQAPLDVQLNQRLALLYTRAGNFANAADRCLVLKEVYAGAGREKEAAEYAELAAKYRERAGLPPVPDETTTPAAAVAAQPEQVSEPATPVAEADNDSSAADPEAHEIDLSEEWDRVLKAEQGGESMQADPIARPGASPWDARATLRPSPATVAAVGDLVEEARFYMAQSMWNEARMALTRAEAMVPGAPAVVELQSELAVHAGEESSEPATTPPNAKVIEFASAAQFAKSAPITDPWMMPQADQPAAAPPDPEPMPMQIQPAAVGAADYGVVTPAAQSSQTPAMAWGSAAMPAPDSRPDLLPAAPVAESAAEVPSAVTAVEQSAADPWSAHGGLDCFAADLERSLGVDFVIEPPAQGEPSSAETPLPTEPAQPAEPEPVARYMESAAAPPPPVYTPDTVVSTASTQSLENELSSPLSSLFDEFKRDLEAPSNIGDDIETHYNLGLAFKEMGLFDEAIAELQKAALAIQKGIAFPRVLETYTWLADCFVSKGVAQAGIHWYKKALELPNLSSEQSLAVNYELACAEEMAGDRTSARNHFLHVLSLNIDYRDVAERIKALTS